METFTFLFTDIHGSTALLHRLGESLYAQLLADHHSLIRSGFAAHDGTEVDTPGDAFFAVFSSPRACVAAVLEMQQALAAHAWPGGEHVRVRMGVHTGEAARTATGLVGLDVHRAARVAAVGYGGQVLVSETAATLVRDSLPPGASLADLGVHRLKDLGHPERIFQLQAAGLQAGFPPLRSLGNPAPPNNLPVRLTSFLGRELELAALDELVAKARLVTVTGAGGAGKTRLAVEFAAAAAERFRDGAWLVGLAGITDPRLVPDQVMAALGVRQTSETPVLEALRYRLRPAELLLLLDNCEHLPGACAGLAADLVGACPGLRVLATSREPLGVPGEAVFPLPPLAVPPEGSDPEVLASAPAVRLFLSRSALARPGAGAASAAVVARICRALDGLPLAIELAAARAGVLSAEEIQPRLADMFRFLASPRAAADPRHQALGAAIGWSYELLSESERRGFRALSVFAGGFDLAAVAAVCCGGDQAAALDLVDLLAGKSLVVAEPAVGGTRYRMLATICQYAAGRLAEAGEAAQARDRHAEAFLRLAEQQCELPVLLLEQDNFRAALDHALAAAGGGQTGPRLARALGGFWLARGLFQEGRAWLERALAVGPAEPRLRADLLLLLGALLYAAGDMQRAQATLAEALCAAAAAGARSVQARTRVLLAEIQLLEDGRYTEALEECAAAAALLDSDNDLEGMAQVWLTAGKALFTAGESLSAQEALERADAYARQSGSHRTELESRAWLVATFSWSLPIPADVALRRAEQLLEAAAGDPWGEAAILRELSLLYAYAGRFDDARAAYTRSRSEFARAGAKLDWAMCAIPAGETELIAGDLGAAEQILRQGVETLHAMGERGYRSTAVAFLAETLYAQGRFDEAQRLTEDAETLAGADDVASQAQWRATRAKLLARRGEFGAAARLADEALAQIPATSSPPLLGEALTAKAEVLRLAGTPGDAETSLRRALQLYEDRRITPLAERARALLASLAEQHPHAESVNQVGRRPPGAGDPPPNGSPPPMP